MVELHVINKDNKHIVFLPESLKLFLVSEDVGNILEHYELDPLNHKLMVERWMYSESYIENLLKYFKDKAKINTSKDPIWENREPKTLCLFISQDCNLKCSYCFADHGAFGGCEKLMTIDIAKKCFNKILSKKFNNYVLFFGGEPFLNFSLMEELEEYGHQMGLEIKYATITNGTIMNDAIEKFINEKLFSLCISLDGPKEINDLQRHGSVRSVHDQVVMTIKRVRDNPTPLFIKCTATKKSINKLTEIAEYISALGVKSIAFAPVSRIPHESELFISDDEFEMYARELSCILVKNINQLALGETEIGISPIFSILRQLVTKTRVIHHCSAGREYIAVTADGDVYPCHEFVGIEEFKMGNIDDANFPGDAYDKIKHVLNCHSVYAFEVCQSCWARFLCGGDCAVRSYIYNGDLFRPTERKCILIKSILEALLPEIAEIFQDKKKMQCLMNKFYEYKKESMYIS